MKKILYVFAMLVAGAFVLSSCQTGEVGSNDKAAADGEGGSMARMTIVGDYLYTVDDSDLKVFDISTPDNVQYLNSTSIGREIETIFGFKDHLYIGSGTAVYIYSISNPTQPVQVEMIQHTYSCDPVVANDTVALSTIRTTSECRRNSWSVNELILMDVSNVNNIHETMTYTLDFEPYGIGLEDTLFFLCKGDQGIDVFRLKDLFATSGFGTLPPTIAHIGGIHAFDVIPYGNLLIVVGDTGMELYDITDPLNITKLSGIYPD